MAKNQEKKTLRQETEQKVEQRWRLSKRIQTTVAALALLAGLSLGFHEVSETEVSTQEMGELSDSKIAGITLALAAVSAGAERKAAKVKMDALVEDYRSAIAIDQLGIDQSGPRSLLVDAKMKTLSPVMKPDDVVTSVSALSSLATGYMIGESRVGDGAFIDGGAIDGTIAVAAFVGMAARPYYDWKESAAIMQGYQDMLDVVDSHAL